MKKIIAAAALAGLLSIPATAVAQNGLVFSSYGQCLGAIAKSRGKTRRTNESPVLAYCLPLDDGSYLLVMG